MNRDLHDRMVAATPDAGERCLITSAFDKRVSADEWCARVRRLTFTRDLDQLPMSDQLRTFEAGAS